ncbi:glycoside hydrolase family 15 protein [Sphingomonas sp. CGMCC 1.13654]|uniref:Glycoside hydrolase family 15 protein n=1 Tax=Sphingomonas chungangi TaxID=2683589 RepID=A0A838LAF7_9SPHN|nr:glycoside hydrolase family 15 protein [Sphingomonas chungangi]MBA2934478.1 glycoside hydrolase family 15 protein [Sphingomonas chungangi]MVW57517.1 glycoside hydrolase family 15 protein [Sphingomonas chungangi]
MKGWRPGRIEDHGMIGDGETAALVHRDGTIDWLSMPRFDSEVCLAALLGTEENGGWWLGPKTKVVKTSRRYLDDTLVLETLVETRRGTAAILDFMPTHRGQAPDIVRIVEGRSGTVEMMSKLALRFDHGRTHPLVRTLSLREVVAIAGPNAVVLRFETEIVKGERCFDSRFTVRAGEQVAMTMTWFPSHEDPPEPVNPPLALRETCDFWRRWVGRINFDGAERDPVVRSLILLKSLVHRQTGGMLAAATASLPERTAGSRNWDYRFCWLRDATFTLQAFLRAGLKGEARAWIEWMRRAIAGEPTEVQPAYSIDGGRLALEWEADWLAGFGGAQPVRFGNAALGQCQLDVYGEVLDALSLATDAGMEAPPGHPVTHQLAEKLVRIWQQPDAGIWESRGPLRHHTYSKAMCWVAFDRAASLIEGEAPREAKRYRRLADRVRKQVLGNGFDESLNTFTRAYDDKALDAATLRLALVGFLDARDERMIGTVAAIERDLIRGGLVYRYSTDATDDGVGGEEGAFLAAGCWLAEVYHLQGRSDDARALLGRIGEAANDLGLLAEEAAPDGRMLGNIPQALSHVAFVNATMRLAGQSVQGGKRRP